jgi:hypothetical protein
MTMADINQATLNQLANIEKRTGKTLDDLVKIVQTSGLTKHGQIRDMLKTELGLGFGDAGVLAQYTLNREGMMRQLSGELPANEALASIYSGAKVPLRPIHEKLMDAIEKFGEFEIAPKKTYISLRRARQFAMIGPATNTQVEVGLNMKGIAPTDRLIEQKPGGMCQYKVRLSSVNDVNEELFAWMKTAYDSAK